MEVDLCLRRLWGERPEPGQSATLAYITCVVTRSPGACKEALYYIFLWCAPRVDVSVWLLYTNVCCCCCKAGSLPTHYVYCCCCCCYYYWLLTSACCGRVDTHRKVVSTPKDGQGPRRIFCQYKELGRDKKKKITLDSCTRTFCQRQKKKKKKAKEFSTK